MESLGPSNRRRSIAHGARTRGLSTASRHRQTQPELPRSLAATTATCPPPQSRAARGPRHRVRIANDRAARRHNRRGTLRARLASTGEPAGSSPWNRDPSRRPHKQDRGLRILNIGKLVRDQADYYLDAVARSQEEYYTGAGEAPGYWLGRAAGQLGLAGEVSEEGLHRMLSGAHPHTAERLGRPPRDNRVAAFDLTFRAPKSVSLLYGLGGFEVAGQVRAAHERAIAEALDYLERHAALVSRGHARARQEHADGLVAAAYQHRTSRAGDPLLHTHVLVANLAQGADGRWTALYGQPLYWHAKTAGYLYQAVLRAELTRRLGVAWGPVRNGVAGLLASPRRDPGRHPTDPGRPARAGVPQAAIQSGGPRGHRTPGQPPRAHPAHQHLHPAPRPPGSVRGAPSRGRHHRRRPGTARRLVPRGRAGPSGHPRTWTRSQPSRPAAAPAREWWDSGGVALHHGGAARH